VVPDAVWAAADAAHANGAINHKEGELCRNRIMQTVREKDQNPAEVKADAAGIRANRIPADNRGRVKVPVREDSRVQIRAENS